MITFFFSIAFSIQALAFLGFPISLNIYITASFAPPCRGPFKLAIAPVIAPCISERLLVIVLAVKVETLKLCSAYKIIETSKAFTISLSGTFPNIIFKKFSEKDNFLSGLIIFLLFLILK